MAWETLLGILAESREIAREEATKTPVECPNDFTTLVEGPGGTLHCPWAGDYEYPRDGIPL